MGRFDALTQLEEEPNKTPPLSVSSPTTKKHPAKAAGNKVDEPKMSTNPLARLPTNQSPTHFVSEKPEKYTTHLEPSLIKKVKLHATERDMKDYQVIKNALLLYFEKNK
jgi:hypothetical protein